MGMTLRIGAESGLLRVIATGEFSRQEAERTFLEILDAAGRHDGGVNRILVDGRELQGEPTVIQRFLYGEFAANAVARCVVEHRLARAPQFAYVLLEPVLDPRRFGETVAVNRGLWIKVFDDVEQALAWLG